MNTQDIKRAIRLIEYFEDITDETKYELINECKEIVTKLKQLQGKQQ